MLSMEWPLPVRGRTKLKVLDAIRALAMQIQESSQAAYKHAFSI